MALQLAIEESEKRTLEECGRRIITTMTSAIDDSIDRSEKRTLTTLTSAIDHSINQNEQRTITTMTTAIEESESTQGYYTTRHK